MPDTDAVKQAEALAALRAPFPAAEVGKLPKPYKTDSQKGNCSECGKWHGLPAAHLDYVGHGYLTQRLLDVDPLWYWEPLALGPDGLPALDRNGDLWIRLHVAGMSRIGVGDGATSKIRIGDALRNAGMRFGMALDLWCKGSEDEHDGDTGTAPASSPPPNVEGLRNGLLARIADLSDDDKAALRAYTVSMDYPTTPGAWGANHIEAMHRYLDGIPKRDDAPAEGDAVCTGEDGAACAEPVVIFDDEGRPWCENHRPMT